MRRAVVLFNLGGPLNREGVFPFLFSLFNDPAIIRLPQPFRFLLAQYIARRRTEEARKIYDLLGGGSPILENTEKQAQELESALKTQTRVFVAMRHASPSVAEVVRQLSIYEPQEVVLLPLYPQFSTTTTGSFLRQWKRETRKGFNGYVRTIKNYPSAEGFLQAMAELTVQELRLFCDPPRLLFSAHGLPERIVRKGDPYVSQVKETVRGLVGILRHKGITADWVLCYQSRVGPLAWTQPYMEDEIRRAGKEKNSVLVVPVSFVSEHSETLVELDVTYKDLAETCGVPEYRRVPTVSCHPLFIHSLAELVRTVGRQ